MYRLKQGEQQPKCSLTASASSVGRSANDLSASSRGQPVRSGLGKASERYERAKSRNSRSSKGFRFFLGVLTLESTFGASRTAYFRDAFPQLRAQIPAQFAQRLAKARLCHMGRNAICSSNLFPRVSFSSPVKHVSRYRVTSGQNFIHQDLQFQLLGGI